MEEGTEGIFSADLKSLWYRIKPRDAIQNRWKFTRAKLKVPNRKVQFNTTWILFEVVHEREGGSTRADCIDCWENG